MKRIWNFNAEEQKSIAIAIANNDVDSFKKIINFDSLPADEKVVWMLWYQNMNDTNGIHKNKYSSGNIEKDTLSYIKDIANKRIKGGR